MLVVERADSWSRSSRQACAAAVARGLAFSEGGGRINGGMLAAWLIDEVSVLVMLPSQKIRQPARLSAPPAGA